MLINPYTGLYEPYRRRKRKMTNFEGVRAISVSVTPRPWILPGKEFLGARSVMVTFKGYSGTMNLNPIVRTDDANA